MPAQEKNIALLAHLRSLPFVRGLHLDSSSGTMELTTPRGRHYLSVEVKRSYLDSGLLNALLSRASQEASGKKRVKARKRIVLARYIPTGAGEQLIEAGICFADNPGNMYLRLGDDYSWTVLGKREPPRPDESRRTTPATIQLMFQFAVEPESAKWTVRDLAKAAGISKTKVAELRNQFQRDGLLTSKSEFHLTSEIADRLISGYVEILRPKLIVGRYRYPEPAVDNLLERVSEQAKARKVQYALTGAPAAEAMQHFYHGAQAPLFLAAPDPGILRSLRLLPDRNGPVIVLKPFGELVYWKEFDGRMVAPPWLVYAELLTSADPRAREAAEELRREFLE